jgi:antitoxin component YwqK of YwqJK toxin-antitoxin module
MRKDLLPLFLPTMLFLFVLPACREAGNNPSAERIEHFETGAVSRRVALVDGKKEGKMIDFYPNGQLMAERWFKNDRQTGRTVLYYPGGQIKEVQYYNDTGLKQGGDTLWYEDGRLQFATIFDQGLKHGYLRKWSTDGSLVFEARYAHDTLIEVKGKQVLR